MNSNKLGMRDLRVLIISNNALSSVTNNGKTYSALFNGIPSSNIAQLYFGTNEKPDINICDNYYRVTEIDIFKSIVNMSFKTYNTHSSLVNLLQNNPESRSSKFISFLKRHNKTLSPIREFMWSLKTWNTKEFDEWVRAFNPNIIFSVLGSSIFVHKIVLALSDKYNIPFVTFYTDDYYINNFSANLIEKYQYKRLKKQYLITNKKAEALYVIGDLMKKEYSATFKRDFGVLINSIDFDKLQKNELLQIKKDSEIVISFIGGVHLNRWKSIVKLGNIVGQINEQNNLNIIIKVFTTYIPDNCILESFKELPIEYCGSLDSNGVLRELSNSHFLLHVESFDEKNRLYTRYSISTKIPEYLSSMRAVIAFGPSEVASIRLFKENSLGIVITDNDTDDEIKSKLLYAIDKYNTYDFEKQYQFAFRNFNKKAISANLQNDMLNIINNYNYKKI